MDDNKASVSGTNYFNERQLQIPGFSELPGSEIDSLLRSWEVPESVIHRFQGKYNHNQI